MSRLEHDFLGELTIDDSVYYGVQTLRAMNNFHISGTPLSQFPEMIWALACVKKACALANMELQALPRDIGIAICAACDRILAGNMLDQFPVDCIQGGAGTSTNMNANEVIANLALEIMGHPKGAYTYCHPNNHVNCSQSTNDVYPTALRLALFRLLDYLVEHMIPLQKGFAAKSVEFSHIVKMGRTQLQDAVPMTLGQEFGSYATTIGEDISASMRRRNCCWKSIWGPRPSGQASILPRAMRSSWSRAWPRSVTSPFGSPPIWWKRRGIPAPMCRHPAS